ncbi:helix-turn-helix domain-containing protein [Streptomyces sp. NPDC001514]
MHHGRERADAAWVTSLTGLTPDAFAALVSTLRAQGVDKTRRGRPWSLPLERRVLLVAAYLRTNLTLRHIAGLFDVSKSSAGRIVDSLGPYLALEDRYPRRGQHLADPLDGTPVSVSFGAVDRGPGESPYAPRRKVRIDTRTRLTTAAGADASDIHPERQLAEHRPRPAGHATPTGVVVMNRFRPVHVGG